MSVFAASLLIALAPLMRGGNRQIALIVLEAVGVLFLLSIGIRASMGWNGSPLQPGETRLNKLLIAFLVLSPAWLALVYLTPVSSAFWSGLPGHSPYGPLMAGASIPIASSIPLSLAPDATKASLLVGIPLVAGFLAGYASRLSQLKLLLWGVAGMAFLQVLFGLMQAAGGSQSSLYFTAEFAGRPFGTFANTNHFANYIAMALVAYIWLGWMSLTGQPPGKGRGPGSGFGERHAQAFWIAGGLLLVLGMLMTLSRGAAVSGLPAALLAAALGFMSAGRLQNWRSTFLLIGGVLLVALMLVGAGALFSKFDLDRLAHDASFRGLLASSTLAGAQEFWPWGSGWGTYAAVYPRFQPVAVDGFADYAHQDYAQMLFEGGIFSALLAAAFLWLVASRAIRLAQSAATNGLSEPDHVAAAVCGLGLLGFLLHSLIEFNMHIPANAILASLLAGAYLRPLRPIEKAR